MRGEEKYDRRALSPSRQVQRVQTQLGDGKFLPGFYYRLSSLLIRMISFTFRPISPLQVTRGTPCNLMQMRWYGSLICRRISQDSTYFHVPHSCKLHFPQRLWIRK